MASSRTLEVLDLEGTGLSNQSAQVDQSQCSIQEAVASRCALSQYMCVFVFVCCVQVFLDMVENYPTCLRVLVLAENDISGELQQQISDLLSEGEEEEERGGAASPWTGQVSNRTGHTSSCALLPFRDKYQPIRNKYQHPTCLPHSSKG